MESAPLGADLDDREEGEIVDDDFEDISDNSIIVPIFSGKSVSSKEHLPAISLSSVTDLEEPKNESKVRHRHKIPRRKSLKSSKKRRNSHRKSACSDSDSDELDKKLQEQLKAAIRINDTEDRHKNSLQSRLKGMTKSDELDKNDEVEKKDNSDDGDNELAQLRMEALRTAVLNKFMHRKKRKIKENNDNDVLSDGSVKTDNSEMNKENNHEKVLNCNKKLCTEAVIQITENKTQVANHIANITPPEDDEDVLRALLLASMSRKITSGTRTKKTVAAVTNGVKRTVEERKEAVNNVASSKNHAGTNTVLKKNLQLPKIKPLIINVNESDSEDDIFNKTVRNTELQVAESKRIDKEIESTVEKFLKEQRAKVEAQLSAIPKILVKPTKIPPTISKNVLATLEKPAVNLLSKEKQMEYQKLVAKLENAKKRPRVRRLSHKFNGEGRTIVQKPKKIVRPKVPLNKQANAALKTEPVPTIKNEIRTLHKILKEIQVQKNGRLQIQENYKVLMPVIKKINEASVDRRKWEDEVKRLLREITEAKKNLVKSQEDFNVHVKNLIREKEQIDKSASLKKPQIVEEIKKPFTSTPIKGTSLKVSFETSSIPVITPNDTLSSCDRIDEPAEDENFEVPLNPGDPNDIDKIYSKEKNTFLKYISPLDNVKRVATDDPFSIVCPYDVDGNCRDPECIYRHLFK